MSRIIMTGFAVIVFAIYAASWANEGAESGQNFNKGPGHNIQLGPRPFFFGP